MLHLARAPKPFLRQTEVRKEVAVVPDDNTRRESCLEACPGASPRRDREHLAGPAPSNLREFVVVLSGDDLTITL